MSVTPGPYFLGELLSVDLTLINRTHTKLILAGTTTPSACGSSALLPVQTGGIDPRYALYTMPVPFVYSCSVVMAGNGPALVPGQTVATHFYVLLTSSGNVTLIGKPFFYTSPTSLQGDSGPLTGHLPTLFMHVSPQVPVNRRLSLQPQGSEALIQAPAGVQLLDQTYVICQDANYHAWPSGTGQNNWEQLATNVLHRLDCGGRGLTFVQWKYVVGSVGYEAAQGQQGQYTSSHGS